ncbi:hypothetical protein BJX99DRAFT_254868 [Aspergillus californicus]
MPDLTTLPFELLDQILSLAFAVAPRYQNDYDDGALDVKGLSRLLLVSRKYHQWFLPRVYSSWTFNGARHSYSGLWKFIRTAIGNPDIAATVQVLNVSNWGVCPLFYLDRNRELQEQDEQLQFTHDDEIIAKIRIQRAVLLDLGPQLLDAIFETPKRDWRPLIALLLASLPCVSKVIAHIPASDPFLAGVLRTALDYQQAGVPLPWLHSLREIHVLSEVPGPSETDPKGWNDDLEEPPLKFDHIWPIFYLQGLHTVRLYNLDPYGFSQLLQQKIQSNENGYECNIEHLHIATKQTSVCRAKDVTALLTLPSALKGLSFSWDEDKAKPKEKINGRRRNIWQISNHQVWTAIQKYKATLEYLDVMHNFQPQSRKRRPTDFFGPLAEFTQLCYLSIMAEMLIGGYVEDAVAPLRLEKALPPSITTLVFAAQHAGETIPDLSSQLEDVVSQFLCLETFQFTDAWFRNNYFPPGTTPDKYQPLRMACFHRGIQFGMQAICRPRSKPWDCPFPLGARCLSQWKESHNTRVDGGFRYERMRKRAERKARGQRETPSPSPSPPPPQSWTNKTHVLPFQDHAGYRFFMVFESEENTFLPPLVNINMYFTHSEGPLPEPAELEEDLRAMHDQIATDGFGDASYRLDIYFLPSASSEACIAHYQAEKAVRGNSFHMRHEAEIRLDTDSPPPTTPRLPGMVEIYDRDDSGVLFVYPDQSWRGGRQRMCYLHSPPGLELGPQAFDAEWYPEGDESLGYVVWELARHDWQEHLGIYHNVTQRGWTTCVVFEIVNNAKKIARTGSRAVESAKHAKGLGLRIDYTENDYKMMYSYEPENGASWQCLAIVDTLDMTDPDFTGPVMGVFAVARDAIDVQFKDLEIDQPTRNI